MCGFVGIFSRSATDPGRGPLIEAMRATIAHRGPDGSGAFIGDHVALGFARLAVIDAAGGEQPMAAEDGRVQLVFNGEIYNYQALRAELEARGVRFRSRSDTEVLLRSYLEWGVDCLPKLRGIFAFAIWDARSGALLMARDRSGIKPLYLQRDRDTVRFASEAKAILADPAVPRALDLAGCFGAPADGALLERTAFAGIAQLGAGWALAVSLHEADRCWRYWSYAPARDGVLPDSDEDVIASFRGRLDEVVAMQMAADGPVGASLSGGIDSSAIVACMARHAAQPVPTYTSVVEYPGMDDAWLAFALSRQLTTRARFLRFAVDGDVLAMIPFVAWAAEGDFDLGFVARFDIARAARADGLKVLLSGEGADEILTGYHRSFATFESTAARQLARRSSVEGRRFDAAGAMHPVAADDDTATDQLVRDHASLATFLLRLEDRMGMLAGVEVRVPFLDHQLIELCARIPPARRRTLLSDKRLLRAAMLGAVPDLIRNRPKHAFNGSLPPITRVLERARGDASGLRDLLSPDAVKARGYFAPANVEQFKHAGNYQALDGVLIVHLLDELFVRAFDPGRFVTPPSRAIEDVTMSEAEVPLRRLAAMAGGLSGGTVPALDPAVTRIGRIAPVPSGRPSVGAEIVTIHFDHGEQRLLADSDVQPATAPLSLSAMLRLVDGTRSYREIARELGAPIAAVLDRARLLHDHGILRPVV